MSESTTGMMIQKLTAWCFLYSSQAKQKINHFLPPLTYLLTSLGASIYIDSGLYWICGICSFWDLSQGDNCKCYQDAHRHCHSLDLFCAALCHVIVSDLHSDFSCAEIWQPRKCGGEIVMQNLHPYPRNASVSKDAAGYFCVTSCRFG